MEHGNQYSLKLNYEHSMERSAFNMCKGSFGGSQGRHGPHDYICVQSLDGMLSIFEYESFAISFFLPKVLIPGPVRYVPGTDSFLAVSASWELETYRYQALVSVASKQKRLQPEYSFNLGEPVVDIQLHTVSNATSSDEPANSQGGGGGSTIVVLGERNLFAFTQTCTLKFMKKLDYEASALCLYSPLANTYADNCRFIVATHAKIVYVHERVKVKWAAQLEHVPVQVTVARIGELDGVLVTLSEDGKLRCSYLGTEPAYYSA